MRFNKHVQADIDMEQAHRPQKLPVSPFVADSTSSASSIPPPCPLPSITHLFSLLTALPFPKWNINGIRRRVAFVSGYFRQSVSASELHPDWCLDPEFVPFSCWRLSHCITVPRFVDSFSSPTTLAHFRSLALLNNATTNICVRVFG